MDKDTVLELKNAAEQRCGELFTQLQNVTTELERTRGDFRTYEGLLAKWGDSKVSEVSEGEVIEKKGNK